MSWLDDILATMAIRVIRAEDDVATITKDQIKTLMLEMIGEDIHDFFGDENPKVIGYNRALKELRQKVNRL